MASRFYAPTGAQGAAEAIQAELLRRAEEQRQAQLDAERRQQQAAQIDIQKRQMAIQEAAAARAAAKDEQDRAKAAQDRIDAQAKIRIEQGQPGDISQGEADTIGSSIYEGMLKRGTLPSRTQVGSLPTPGGDQSMGNEPSAPPPVPGVMTAPVSTPGGQNVLLPTAAQRKEQDALALHKKRVEAIMADPNASDGLKQWAQLADPGENPPAELLRPEKQPRDLFLRRNGTMALISPQGQLVPLPADFKRRPEDVVHQEPAPSGGNGPSAYFSPVQTGTGIYNYDHRTGQFTGRLGDLRPGAGAGAQIANLMNIGQQIDTVKKEFNPEFVGVLQGRLNNIKQEYWGSDPDYARFQSELRTLGNTIIQARTGAAMSVEEAKRILAEVTNEKLPAKTFLARLNRMEELYDQTLANQAKVSFGRMTAADIDSAAGGSGAPTGVQGGGGPKRKRYDESGNLVP